MLKKLQEPFQYERTNQDSVKQKGKSKAKAKNWVRTLKRIWSYLAAKKSLLYGIFFLVVISSILGLLGPILIGFAIDDYIANRELDGFAWLLGGLASIYVLYSASIWLQNYWMIGIAQQAVYRMRKELFSHLHQLPLYYFQDKQHGQLMSRVTNDIDNVSRTLNSSVISIFSSLLTLIGMITVMLWLSPLLTMVTMLIIPLLFFGMKWITKRTEMMFKAQQRYLGEVNGFVEETISGQRVIKAYSQEKRVIQAFLEKSERLKTAGFWAQTISGFIPKLMNLLNGLSFTIIAAIGGFLAFKNIITVGVIVIFIEYARQFTRPLNDLANQYNTLLSAIAGAERVFEIIDEPAETEDEKAVDIELMKGNVTFDNVFFSYEKAEETLKNINFHVEAGKTVALVGPTGAGKTTLLHILARFYEPTSGKILMDGKDISHISRESLRSNMAFVLQDPCLFAGTIRENIRYGKLNAADEEVTQAAKEANAHEFIMRLPEQYDTIIKQGGDGISQGQKQLVSIARAILRKPSILLLDEATSSIDTITEIKIQEALGRLMQGRTSFVIAHRLNTIQYADMIIVLSDGEIAEFGTHESLLEQKGSYYHLYQTQLNEHTKKAGR